MGQVVRCWLLLVTALTLVGLETGARARGLTRQLRKEATILGELSELNGQVVAVTEQLDDLKHEQAQLGYQIDEARRRILALERRSAERRGHLKQRVRGLYKLSRGGIPRLVLEGAGPRSDLAHRLSSVRLILRRDAREIALYQRERRRLDKERADLSRKAESSKRMHQQLVQRSRELEQKRQAQLRTLSRLKRNRSAQSKVAEQLNRQQRRLMRKIGDLSYQLYRGGFAARRGELKPPVTGSVVGVFGHKLAAGRRQLEVLRHGVAFRPARSRVRSVAAGDVQIAGPLAGYGNIVLLQHDGGYFTLYGHLGRLRVSQGQPVKEGQTLGRAGTDPLTGRRSVYFEIRRGDRPLDPVAWLRR